MLRNQTRGKLPQKRRISTPKSRGQENSEGLLSLSFKSSLFGVAVWGIACLLLTLAATAFAYAAPDPSALIPYLSVSSALISAFVGGFATEKKAGDAPMVCGLIFGGLIALISMLLCRFFKNAPSSNYAFWQSALLHGAAVLFSLLGSFTGNAKKKMKTKKRFG